jgi:prenyltransferase beta subunit
VTGRIKHFISAFGEHVIGDEVESAMLKATEVTGAKITEFTVAPYISQQNGKSYHEWLVEFEEVPANIDLFTQTLDEAMRQKNVYYEDLISGNILDRLKVTSLQKNAFVHYMKSEGKLGGQNKVPRLSNDRIIADKLNEWKL